MLEHNNEPTNLSEPEPDKQETNKTVEQSSQENVLKSVPLTCVVCAICILIFIGASQEKDLESWDAVTKWGFYSPQSIWGGKYWGLITSVFVHFQIWHVGFNVYWLWILGGAIEKTIGSLKWLILFLAAAFVSSGIEFAASTAKGGGSGIGLSGVIYAMFGFIWVTRDRYELFINTLPKETINTLMLWLFLCIPLTLLNILNVGNEAHFSGLLFGSCVGSAYVLKYKPRLMIAGQVLLFILAVVPLFWWPFSVDWVSKQAHDAHIKQDYQTAINWYQKSLTLGQDPKWVWTNLAIVYKNLNNQTKYEEALDKLRTLSPDEAKKLEQELQESN